LFQILEANAMLRKFGILLLPLLALTACNNDDVIKGSGNVTTENRAVGKFTAIRLSGIGHLVIERADSESLSVTVDDNLLPLFTTEVTDGILHLSVVKGKRPSKAPTYKVTIRDLREVAVTGSGSIEAINLDGEVLSLSISGSASAKAAGRVDSLTVSISGSGSLGAAGLMVKRATITVSGSGDATVNASDELDASVSGSGDIRYIGSPRLTSRVSGSGSIEHTRD
jgi:Putative auto-transporter adhesin, head GIN domain